MDPVKAAETPVPRGTVTTKKRPLAEDGSPLQIKRQKRPSDPEQPYAHIQSSHHPHMQGHGVLKPLPVSNGPSNRPRIPNPNEQRQRDPPSAPEQQHHHQHQQEEQPPIDPSLFTMYPEPDEGAAYDDSQYPYPSTEQRQPYNHPQQAYQIPSLEQIANEVLVDLNGNETHEQVFNAQHPDVHQLARVLDEPVTASMPNGHAKPDESVDSAVSLPTSEVLEQNVAKSDLLNNQEPPHTEMNAITPNGQANHTDLHSAHQSIETSAAKSNHDPTSPFIGSNTSPAVPKNNVSNLPLYQPPAPPSTSPDNTRQQPSMLNGLTNGKSSSPTEATQHKRKRDSTSTTPGPKSAKKAKVDGAERRQSREAPFNEEGVDHQSLELARMLQQEDLGLRRRSK